MQGVLPSPNTLLFMVHGQAFRIISWQHPQRNGTLYLPPGNTLSISMTLNLKTFISTQYLFGAKLKMAKTLII